MIKETLMPPLELLEAGPSPHRGWSYYGTALKCLRLWALKRQWGDGHGGSPAQSIGAAIHIGLAHFYEAARREVELAHFYEAARREVEGGTSLPSSLEAVDLAIERGVVVLDDQARKRVREALKVTTENAPPFSVIDVETPYPLDLGPLDCPGHPENGLPIIYGPRIDLVYKDNLGKVFIVDHKTTAKGLDKTFLDIYTLHGQFLMMHAIGLAYFKRDFGGVYIHGIQTVPPYRETWDRLPPAPAATQSIVGQVASIAHRVADLTVQGGDMEPLAWPAAFNETVCYHRYGRCEGWTECAWGAGSSAKAERAERAAEFSFDF